MGFPPPRPILAALLAFAAPLSGAEVPRTPSPDWVQPFPLPQGSGTAENGLRHLLVDEQVHAGRRIFHGRYAREFTNIRGVQEGSRIAISFDPSFSTLSLHTLRIHRDGEIIDRLATEEVRMLAREESMEANLYDGSLTAAIDVEDIRVGDVLEYAFSIEGENPVFNGRYSTFVQASWNTPLASQRFRLLWPEGRPLTWTNSADDGFRHTESRADGLIEHLWARDNLPATHEEGDTPAWYSPYEWIQASEYRDWGEVVRWAEDFYDLPDTLPGGVEAEIDRLQEFPEEDTRILGALEYVQKRFRYLSVSSGVHSHAPYPVEEVIRRGYGDCKDKARLLSAMLRKMGFDASPALVNTRFRKTVADWLPTPEAFDHVIVALRQNGRDYWFDPTNTHAAGSLEERFLPDYGVALVLRPGETGLTRISAQGHTAAAIETTETYRIADYANPVHLEIASEYRGGEADWMRGMLAGADREEIRRNYLNFVARMHPGARDDGPPTFKDDEAVNAVEVRERYAIEPFFQPTTAEPGRVAAEVFPWAIEAELREPATSRRRTPLAINHPKTIVERFVMHIPQGGVFKNEHIEIADEAFQFEKNVDFSKNTLTITHRYRTLADAVDPGRIAGHLRKVRSAREQLGYSISVPQSLADPSASGFPASPADLLARTNWLFVGVVLVSAAIFAGLAVAGFFWRPPWPPPICPPGPFGLGGWLVLLGIGVVLTPLLTLVEAIQMVAFLDIHHWRNLTSPDGGLYHWAWAPIILVETAATVAVFFANCLGIALFFGKRRTFPPVCIGILAFTAAFSLADLAALSPLASAFPDLGLSEPKEAVQTSLRAIVWIPYLLVSKRVRSTFVR